MNDAGIVAHRAKESDTMRRNRTYYIGLIDAGKMPCGYRQRPGLLIIQASTKLDALSPDLWQYEGPRVTTKKALKAIARNPAEFLAVVKATYGREFSQVSVE